MNAVMMTVMFQIVMCGTAEYRDNHDDVSDSDRWHC